MTSKEIRKIRGNMSRETFSLLVGVSVPSLWRWETGEASPEGAGLRLLELIKDKRVMVTMLRDYVSRRIKNV
jgi:DNA-binding transcriptional regulator YiaG